MNQITISDVAKMANVSKSTISNYINKKYFRMSEETRYRIKDAIEKLNYFPNLSAQNISNKQKTKVIGIIIPYKLKYAIKALFISECLKGIGDRTESLGYRNLIFPLRRQVVSDDISFIRGLGKGMVDGFLIFAVKQQDMLVEELEKSNIPYVSFGKTGSVYNKYVCFDHEKGVHEAIDYLVKKGHKRIAILLDSRELVVSTRNTSAYIEALHENGISVNEDFIIYLDEENPYIYEKVRHLITSNEAPTAFYTKSDFASELVKAIHRLGKTVPGDCDVILSDFFKNDDENSNINGLSHVEMPVYELGVLSVEKLIVLINNPEDFRPATLDVKLMIQGKEV